MEEVKINNSLIKTVESDSENKLIDSFIDDRIKNMLDGLNIDLIKIIDEKRFSGGHFENLNLVIGKMVHDGVIDMLDFYFYVEKYYDHKVRNIIKLLSEDNLMVLKLELIKKYDMKDRMKNNLLSVFL